MMRRNRVFGPVQAAFYVICVMIVHLPAAEAAAPSVVGLWQTIDDKTHKPKSIVETYLRGGRLYGRVKQILHLEQGVRPQCDRCDGAKRNAPVEGLEIMWDLADDKGSWEKGSVLDPANGTVYRCRVWLAAPDRLEVRGFVGISLFGRTQIWERVAQSAATADQP